MAGILSDVFSRSQSITEAKIEPKQVTIGNMLLTLDSNGQKGENNSKLHFLLNISTLFTLSNYHSSQNNHQLFFLDIQSLKLKVKLFSMANNHYSSVSEMSIAM